MGLSKRDVVFFKNSFVNCSLKNVKISPKKKHPEKSTYTIIYNPRMRATLYVVLNFKNLNCKSLSNPRMKATYYMDF